MPEVSVLIPVYNGEAHVAAALETVLAQRGPSFEAVVVDDGSTDSTPVILERFGQDSRVRVLAVPHGGIAAALRSGMQACSGEFICRMDSDDLMPPDRIAVQTDYLRAHPEIGLVGGQVRHEPAEGGAGFPAGSDGMARYVDWMNSQRTHDEMFEAIWTDSPLAHPSVMFRKPLAEQAGGYRMVPWAEDTDLWYRLFLAGAGFAKVDAETVVWRDRPDRLTRTDPDHYGQERLAVMKAHYLPRFFRRARQGGVTLLGAGPFGRRIARALRSEGVAVNRFVDVDPAKIGRTRSGVPVVPVTELGAGDSDLLVAAVGQRGARQEIVAALGSQGIPYPEPGRSREETRVVFCH